MTGGNIGLHFTTDGFRVLYCVIAVFMWGMTTLFSKEYMAHYQNKFRYYMFTLLTFIATVGVFLSADLYTTFVFFEMMSLTSYVWVVQDEKKEALRAGATYLAIAIIGGLVMLMGIFMLYHAIGTLEISQILPLCREYENKTYLYVAGSCMLFGFGAKAGAFPLHIWLPKAHPAAPAPASALLSGILTKTGIFGIIILTCCMFAADVRWGTLILIIGTVTMFLGALLALYSINIKRTLACSSISQIGFILVGVGMQNMFEEVNGYAVRGTILHMVNHSVFKLVLFMVAGVIYMNLHKLDLNEIRGFGRRKPLLMFIYLMGALGIGGIPLWSGYVSKTLLHESIVEYAHMLESGELSAVVLSAGAIKAIEWIFLISGGITVAYMLKLFMAVFVEKNADESRQKEYDALSGKYMSPLSSIALTLSAVVIPVFGMLPHLTMDRIADMSQSFMNMTEEAYRVAYFSGVNLKGAAISIVIGVALYYGVVRAYMMKQKENGVKEYVNRWNPGFDLENLVYRPLLLTALPFVGGTLSKICDGLTDYVIIALRKTIYRDSRLPHELDEGTTFTHIIGSILDGIAYGVHRIIGKETEESKSYEHRFAIWHERLRESNMIIARSLSFGLFLFGIGLLLTMLYLLWN